jgi:hypothetical protein
LAVDFHNFHLIDLPRRLREGCGLSAAELSRELPPLCIRLHDTDNAYTYRPMPYTIDIVAGTEASVVIECNNAEWASMLMGVQSAAELFELNSGEQPIDNDFFQRWQLILNLMYNE